MFGVSEIRAQREALKAERETLRMAAAPAHWKRSDFIANGQDITCFQIDAETPKMQIAFCTGFNSSPLAYIPKIEEMVRQGISVCAMALPDPGNKEYFMPAFLDATEGFYFSENSPALHSGLPTIVLTHSTGGMLFSRQMTEKHKAGFACAQYAGAIHLTPFFDAANASERHNPICNLIHTTIAKWHKPLRTEEHFLGKAMIYSLQFLSGVPETISSYEDPTYGQVLRLQTYARECLKSLESLKEDHPARDINQMFIAGARDSCACPKMAEDAANAIDAGFYTFDSGHNPILESDDLLADIITVARGMGHFGHPNP